MSLHRKTRCCFQFSDIVSLSPSIKIQPSHMMFHLLDFVACLLEWLFFFAYESCSLEDYIQMSIGDFMKSLQLLYGFPDQNHINACLKINSRYICCFRSYVSFLCKNNESWWGNVKTSFVDYLGIKKNEWRKWIFITLAHLIQEYDLYFSYATEVWV
jgi:hypothetical protein